MPDQTHDDERDDEVSDKHPLTQVESPFEDDDDKKDDDKGWVPPVP